jgi:hypothetical protein
MFESVCAANSSSIQGHKQLVKDEIAVAPRKPVRFRSSKEHILRRSASGPQPFIKILNPGNMIGREQKALFESAYRGSRGGRHTPLPDFSSQLRAAFRHLVILYHAADDRSAARAMPAGSMWPTFRT